MILNSLYLVIGVHLHGTTDVTDGLVMILEHFTYLVIGVHLVLLTLLMVLL